MSHRISRRALLAATSAAAIAGAALPRTIAAQAAQPTPQEALARLLAGNARFVEYESANPNQTPARRSEVIAGQRPFAAILACADSRVPPEIVFDTGIGDLFVVRVAGNISTPELVGSLEYATATFATPLIVVLGHERCGAVEATIDAVRTGGTAPGSIGSIVTAIRPPVVRTLARRALPLLPPGVAPNDENLLVDATIENVRYVVDQVRGADAIIGAAYASGRVGIVGMYYSLDGGEATVVM